ncbi:MAG TPA: FAD-dependent oxidoreductase, partial [Chitinophagaceae bacterium]|nr:FAD-dependent oxidoreductase [Chitinophagaceae bacterium]
VVGEKNLQVWFHSQWVKVEKKQDQWLLTINRKGKPIQVRAKMLIDATELGDIMAATGTAYRLGMDSRFQSGEMAAPFTANHIIQDMTYVAVLKDFGQGADKTIPKPAGYDPAEFHCSCDVSDPASFDSPKSNCYQMMQYGRLPHNKYMINWPKCGNDIYLNIVEMKPAEREKALEEAKLHTLRFVYYLQTELGYKHLGLADDEFPTADRLPMIPYHRESRRLEGLVTLSLNEVASPYTAALPLYRTGIAVGDYPIDHHHLKNPSAPAIDFVKIKVPSYNVPMGSLIPEKTEGLIVAEKSISVTNIVNGTTRLQPVVMQIGQAAGAMAALCIQKNIQPRQLSVRVLQQALLKAKVYLMPFIDVPPSDPQFESIQKIGATGILQGKGIPYKWANQTWFYPDQPLTQYDLLQGLKTYYPDLEKYNAASGEWLTANSFYTL